MAISERLNQDQLNIRQLQEPPEPRPELPFDVERDIDPDVKNNLIERIEDQANVNNVYKYLSLLAQAKLLWPDQTFPNDFSDEILISKYKTQTDRAEFLDFTTNLFLARPDINLSISESEWSALRQSNATTEADGYIITALELANLKIINPQLAPKLTKDYIDKLVEELWHRKNSGNLLGFIYLYSRAKLADSTFPSIEINSDDWKELHANLKSLSDDFNWHDFMDYALAMKIAAAHKVEIITPGVIEFQMHPLEDLNQPTPPIPETRKF